MKKNKKIPKYQIGNTQMSKVFNSEGFEKPLNYDDWLAQTDQTYLS